MNLKLRNNHVIICGSNDFKNINFVLKQSEELKKDLQYFSPNVDGDKWESGLPPISLIWRELTLGHFGIAYGTGASSKFETIDKLIPSHKR